MEYLTTYGWAILVTAIVIAALYLLGVFNSSTYAHNTCAFEADFSCIGTVLSSNGMLFLNLVQSTPYAINVTSISCDSDLRTLHPEALTPAVQLSVGQNHTFNVQCYTNTSAYSGTLGGVYSGYIIIIYTPQQTGFPHQELGPVTFKVERK